MRKLSLTELSIQVESKKRLQRLGQLRCALRILDEHPSAVLIECTDEHTGVRFGNAKKRIGQCVKLGRCRQPYYYQLWASWAPADIKVW